MGKCHHSRVTAGHGLAWVTAPLLGLLVSGGCCQLQVPSYRFADSGCRAQPAVVGEFAGEPCTGPHGLGHQHLLGSHASADATMTPPRPKFHPVPTRPVFAPRTPTEAISPIPEADATQGLPLLTPGSRPTIIEPIRGR